MRASGVIESCKKCWRDLLRTGACGHEYRAAYCSTVHSYLLIAAGMLMLIKTQPTKGHSDWVCFEQHPQFKTTNGGGWSRDDQVRSGGKIYNVAKILTGRLLQCAAWIW